VQKATDRDDRAVDRTMTAAIVNNALIAAAALPRS
jgi:hypothetical protein